MHDLQNYCRMHISADRLIADEQDEQAEVEAETTEPETDEVEEQEYAPAQKSVQRSRMWQLYRNAKAMLDRKSDAYDPNTAVDLLIEAAELGCGVAKYRLGKMFLRGEDVPKNIDYALRWLEEAVSEGNQYAEYGSIAKGYGYNVSVIDLRNPTRSNGNNLLHLVNKYMDLYQANSDS